MFKLKLIKGFLLHPMIYNFIVNLLFGYN